MTMHDSPKLATLRELDRATQVLVRVAAVVAAGVEEDIRGALAEASADVPHVWIEELLLQTYLFAGFPRALNAFREWRRFVPNPIELVAPKLNVGESRIRGEATCQSVYGTMYEKLRVNINGLHPALDAWMIAEGYGKVLARPGLDLQRRELCIVAACVASGQDRQLHSHLHGALNVGVAPEGVRAALDAVAPVVSRERVDAARALFAKIARK